MGMRKKYRGKWGGLTAVTVSMLLGCSVSNTKRLLALRQTALGREITLEDIGRLIFEFRSPEPPTDHTDRWQYTGSF